MKERKLQNNVQFSKTNHKNTKCKILTKAQYKNLSFQCLFRQGEKISTQIEMDHLLHYCSGSNLSFLTKEHLF